MPTAMLTDSPADDHQPDRQRESQHDDDLERGRAELRPGERRVAAPAVLVGEIGHRRHHQQRHDDAGNDAARNSAPIETFAIMP